MLNWERGYLRGNKRPLGVLGQWWVGQGDPCHRLFPRRLVGKGQILRIWGPRHGRYWGHDHRFLWFSGFSKGLLSALAYAANSLSFPKLSSLASVNWWIFGWPSAFQATHPWNLLFFWPLFWTCAGLSCLHSALSPCLGDLVSLHLSLVLTLLQFPTQLMTSFLNPLNLFISSMLINMYGVLTLCLTLC